ncbi:MAG: hypothetical protein IJL52_09325 [Clostridia bacterium]|nr:hypothetical protein [Clostridia bacterium]
MIYTTEILREELSNYQNPNDKIHRMVQEQKLFPVVRGLYTTDPKANGKFLAGAIYGPSYLSFDYALAEYHLIEAHPNAFQSATYGKHGKKQYNTPFGRFTYRDVPEEVFDLFVRNVSVAGNVYRIASPEKAICDKVYSMRPAMNEAELETLVFDFIGIDRRRFRSLHLDEILCMGEKYHSKNVNLLLEYTLKIILAQLK